MPVSLCFTMFVGLQEKNGLVDVVAPASKCSVFRWHSRWRSMVKDVLQ